MRFLRLPLFRLLCVGISFLVVVSLSRSVWRLWNKQDVLLERQDALSLEKTENIRLKQELETVQAPEFIEKEAREKLGMVKEGETVILMPNDKFQMTNEKTEEKTTENLPNWKKWWRLFF